MSNTPNKTMQTPSKTPTIAAPMQPSKVIPIGANAYFFLSNAEDALTVSVPIPFSKLDISVAQELNLSIDPVDVQYRLHVTLKAAFPAARASQTANIKVAAWNCGNPTRSDLDSILTALCEATSPEILIILGTHNLLGQMLSMISALQFESCQIVSALKYSGSQPSTQPEQTAGGICIAWKRFGFYLDRAIMNGATTYLKFLPMYAGCPLFILPPPPAPAEGPSSNQAVGEATTASGATEDSTAQG